MNIQVPASVRDYLHNRVIQSVVNHMLDQPEDELPPELEWHELRDYHNAWLAARKVKVDYSLVLMDVWEAVWLPVLEKYRVSELDAWALATMQGNQEEPSLARCWRDESFYRYYTINPEPGLTCHLFPQIYLQAQGEITLTFAATDQHDQILSTSLPLSRGWKIAADEYGNRETQAGICQINQHTDHVDMSPLRRLADEVVGYTLDYARQSYLDDQSER